ncbi:MAG: FAD-binding oxidoreductase [Myxococcales bacterium]|nr:FAD-binding oxidoreductase [Myxococcales bacterium]MDH5566382.1 FAD-binding oxidoreductase [Myxococcales bacterium]
MPTEDYRTISFWHETLPDPIEPRAPLERDEQVDVAIVGAGYTGLWTAYYLKTLQPDLRVAVLEAQVAGYGASGRNGGWCEGFLAGLDGQLADTRERPQALALQRAMFDTVDEVGRVAAREGIECHYKKGGYLRLATSGPQLADLEESMRFYRELGFGDDVWRWLEREEIARRARVPGCRGALYSPHCAAIHPARLARGLAAAVERKGVALYERSPVLRIEARRAVTPGGALRADVVVRAVEGYTPRLPGEKRTLIPLHSQMIATEPLSEALWKEIGLEERETFADSRRTVTYGQRTVDGRIAFGGRGLYYYGSAIRDRFPADDPLFRRVHESLLSIFPVLADVRITHRWGGPLAVPRNWRPGVGVDRGRGFAWAGGYVGEGVGATNLAARTLADLILERDTECARLPWAGTSWPRWEPEPLRWLGVKGVRTVGESADAFEFRHDRTPRVRAAIFDFFVRK